MAKTKKERKPKVKKYKSQKWKLYELGDTIKRKNKSCPKCGEGVFMAHHHDRDNCGKCGYTEFRRK
ncbi:MAG: 30S ribosomal protein S27ae [Candidatus Altiarchaeales archaeon]|nr:MAG: 30S ribosomal protein S27ae [Candidatus Altiarchaeales archaeon]HDI73242.1 30S ribosomal protein S27ae [Candidatus Altiarchaeales archaeon]